MDSEQILVQKLASFQSHLYNGVSHGVSSSNKIN